MFAFEALSLTPRGGEGNIHITLRFIKLYLKTNSWQSIKNRNISFVNVPILFYSEETVNISKILKNSIVSVDYSNNIDRYL